MSQTLTVYDPFLGKDVQISDNLIDRLRGKYAVGPMLPDGEPEFGWRQHETPPIQHEAATALERLGAEKEAAEARLAEAVKALVEIANLPEVDGDTAPNTATRALQAMNCDVGGALTP